MQLRLACAVNLLVEQREVSDAEVLPMPVSVGDHSLPMNRFNAEVHDHLCEQVVGIVVLSALFLGERDIFTVRMVIGCAPTLPCPTLPYPTLALMLVAHTLPCVLSSTSSGILFSWPYSADIKL